MEPIISKLAHSYVDADDLDQQLRRLFKVLSCVIFDRHPPSEWATWRLMNFKLNCSFMLKTHSILINHAIDSIMLSRFLQLFVLG